MTDAEIGSTEKQVSILGHLRSSLLQQDDLDLLVTALGRSGVLKVRQGQILGAECGKLQGNGALLTLVALGTGTVESVPAEKPVERSVTVTLPQLERFFTNLSNFSEKEGSCDEQATLQDAVHLFLQFRRKEAGAKLVQVLRSNRFYYPAWLWHSRLMTRDDYIKKSLNEAKKWGNADSLVKKEIAKIVPRLEGKSGAVRRCIFCWSPVGTAAEYCENCRGLQRISKLERSEQHPTEDLKQAVMLYEAEMQNNPRNSRIAYCLCLGFSSLGQLDKARGYLKQALSISPKEPLFQRASAVLQPVKMPVAREPKKEVPAQPERKQQVSPVVSGSSPVAKEVVADKTILVVEDSKTARKVVSMVLGRKGYKIIEATTGTEALLAIQGVTPDLVLLDVMLPDMTGYDVLSSIRKSSDLAEIPVVMLTGKRGAADRQKGLISGTNEYLTKPFNPAKLLEVLGRYLDTSKQPVPAVQPAYLKKAPPQPVSPQPKPELKPLPIKMPATSPAVPKAAVTTPALTQAAEPAVQKEGAEKSVLVVEDSPTSRKVITMVLSRNGYIVNEASTGGEAFRKLEDFSPRLILLDAMLPDMTGYDILARLKLDSQLKEIPVVMLTAKDSPVDREKGLRAGSSAYLTKPFNPDKLLSVIGGFF